MTARDGEMVTVPKDAVLAALEYIDYLQGRCEQEFGIKFEHRGPGIRTKPLYEATADNGGST